MAERPLFREPIIDESTLAAFRDQNRRMIDALQQMNAVGDNPHASEDARRQAREDFDREWFAWR